MADSTSFTRSFTANTTNTANTDDITGVRYNAIDKDGKAVPIRLLLTDNNRMIINALQDKQDSITLNGDKWLANCYHIDYHQGDIVPLALGNNPLEGDFSSMLTNVAFVSPANSLGHMGGGIDYPLNHKMFPNVAYNVKAANRQLAERFYAAQDRSERNSRNNRVPIYLAHKDNNNKDSEAATTSTQANGSMVDNKEYKETDTGPWFGPLFNDLGQAFMPVGSASISPTQPRGEVSNGRNQYLVSAPTMYSPGSSISGTGNAGSAVFATLACVQKYNKLLARVNMPPITTIVLPGMGTGVGGMSPYEYAHEAFQAMEEYAKYYLNWQSTTTTVNTDNTSVPSHMVDLAPHMNRFFVRDPTYFLRMQHPDYSMQDFDMCYQLMPRPDAEIERLKTLRPTGGLFGSGSGDMFDHKFGMSGFSAGDMDNVNTATFEASDEFQEELRQRIKDEEEDKRRREEGDDEDDLGAEARMLERMSAMAGRRDKIDEEIERRNKELMAKKSYEIDDFLRERDPTAPFDPNDPIQNMSLEARLASRLAERDEDEEAIVKPLATEAGEVMGQEDMQAMFAKMMAARNNEITGAIIAANSNTDVTTEDTFITRPYIHGNTNIGYTNGGNNNGENVGNGGNVDEELSEEEKAAKKAKDDLAQLDREKAFREMMESRNKVMSDPNSLTGMWH